MGAPGSDIGMESGSSGAEYAAGAAGMGMGSDETYGMMGSATGSSAKFSPLDQPPEVRIARRKLTTVLEYSRFGLDGAVSIQKGKSIPDPQESRCLALLAQGQSQRFGTSPFDRYDHGHA